MAPQSLWKEVETMKVLFYLDGTLLLQRNMSCIPRAGEFVYIQDECRCVVSSVEWDAYFEDSTNVVIVRVENTKMTFPK